MKFPETVLWSNKPYGENYADTAPGDKTPAIGHKDLQDLGHDETASFFEIALEEYQSALHAARPPSPPPMTTTTVSSPSTDYTPCLEPTAFAVYNTLQPIIPGHPQGGWMVTNTRTIPERVSRAPTRKFGGRSIPPPVHLADWNVWTVGNVNIRSSKGGLHLDYLREVLKRTDGIQRRKWTKKELEIGITTERIRQVKNELIVEQPQNWSEGGGWWAYVQPM